MKDLAKFLGVVAAIFGAILFALRATKVAEIIATDDRMAPTILAGDSVFLWRGADIDVGDIAVCDNPTRPGELVMGRVVARAGAEVSSDRRGFLVNGRPFDRNGMGSLRYPDPVSHHEIAVGWGERVTFTEWHSFMVGQTFVHSVRPTRVPAGKVYLLADFESASALDSRTFGPVDVAGCMGEVFMRFKPSTTAPADLPFEHGFLDLLD